MVVRMDVLYEKRREELGLWDGREGGVLSEPEGEKKERVSNLESWEGAAILSSRPFFLSIEEKSGRIGNTRIRYE